MAKVKLTLSYETSSQVFDLEDFGYDEDTKFEDLTEVQKEDITNSHLEDEWVQCSIEEVED